MKEKGKVENVNQSVQLAKEAVSLDLKDGESWCMFFYKLHYKLRSRYIGKRLLNKLLCCCEED